MNNQQLTAFIQESARLENNVGKVYLLLSKLFEEDGEFWLKLHFEEKKHENIFLNFLNDSLPLSLFPEELLEKNMAKILEANAMLERDFSRFLSQHKSKLSAYEYALKIETLAGEYCYQQAMDMESDSEGLYLVQRITADCKDHRQRIEGILSIVRSAVSRDLKPIGGQRIPDKHLP